MALECVTIFTSPTSWIYMRRFLKSLEGTGNAYFSIVVMAMAILFEKWCPQLNEKRVHLCRLKRRSDAPVT
jgi:hypothetical protein